MSAVSDRLELAIEGKTFVVPAKVTKLVNQYDELSVSALKEVADKLNGGRNATELLTGLFVYATFLGGYTCKELTWLCRRLGGNTVRPVANMAIRYRIKHKMLVPA